jgi:hypothetical protein
MRLQVLLCASLECHPAHRGNTPLGALGLPRLDRIVAIEQLLPACPGPFPGLGERQRVHRAQAHVPLGAGNLISEDPGFRS